jgi:hypothetical protein
MLPASRQREIRSNGTNGKQTTPQAHAKDNELTDFQASMLSVDSHLPSTQHLIS